MSTKNNKKVFHVFGGGTINHIRSHFALAAVAYGGTAKAMHALFKERGLKSEIHLTKMATSGASEIETNDDVKKALDTVLDDLNTGVIVFNVAITDFKGQIGNIPSGKYAERMKSREAKELKVDLEMADKLVPCIKERRPDIILVAFKTTTHANESEQIKKGYELLKRSKADLVLANDTGTRNNLILSSSSEEILARSNDRKKIIQSLTDYICHLSNAKPETKTEPESKLEGINPIGDQ